MALASAAETLHASFETEGFITIWPNDSDFQSLVKECFSQAVNFADSVPKDVQRKWTHKSGKVKHLVNPHRNYTSFRRLIDSNPVRELVQSLFGDEPYYVTHSKISYKCQGIVQQWLPHQDSAYKLRFAHGVTLCIFLEDCDRTNGTLEVFPGSHAQGRLPHEMVYVPGEKEPQVRVKDLPSINPISVEATQGTLAAFNLDTIHQSGTNVRGGYRCLYIFEIERACSQPLEQDGRDALVISSRRITLPRPWYLPVRRLGLRIADSVLRPFAKKLLFAVHQLQELFRR